MTWDGIVLWGGGDPERVRERIAAGADPSAYTLSGEPFLHMAARYASPEVLAIMAPAASDIDAMATGRTALWITVAADRPECARILAEAGADPWRPMMAGWSPGRLSLAGPHPFPDPPPGVTLSDEERAMVAAAPALNAAMHSDMHVEGTGMLAVGGIDAAEAIRRLGGRAMTEEELLAHYDVEEDDDSDEPEDELWKWLYDVNDLNLVGVSTVPGGCVVTQPWGYQPQTPVVGDLLSVGTRAYGFYGNPKSGNQGCIFRDGRPVSGDLHPGGEAYESSTAEEVLLSYLHQHHPAAYACAFAGLRPRDARAVTGPADTWVLLPERDYRARH